MPNPSKRVSTKINKSEEPKSNRILYVAYAILSLILISLIVLIFVKVKKNKDTGEVKVIRVANNLDKGFDLCNEASRIYQADNENAKVALEKLDMGISLVEKELDGFRDREGNLPSAYVGYEAKVAIKRAFRKTLREKVFILKAVQERKYEAEKVSIQR